MKAVLRDFSGKPAASALLRDYLRQSSLWTAARVVYGFASLVSEPDWLGADFPEGKVVAFPRTAPGGLVFIACGNLLPGPYGAREPMGDTPAPAADLVLVPGLAFDRAGYRLGRGGGFYDRFLQTLPLPLPTLCGVCFSCQITPAVPREAHDARVDFLLTENGFQKCHEG